jgi:hypothetical protein
VGVHFSFSGLLRYALRRRYVELGVLVPLLSNRQFFATDRGDNQDVATEFTSFLIQRLEGDSLRDSYVELRPARANTLIGCANGIGNQVPQCCVEAGL